MQGRCRDCCRKSDHNGDLDSVQMDKRDYGSRHFLAEWKFFYNRV